MDQQHCIVTAVPGMRRNEQCQTLLIFMVRCTDSVQVFGKTLGYAALYLRHTANLTYIMQYAHIWRSLYESVLIPFMPKYGLID